MVMMMIVWGIFCVEFSKRLVEKIHDNTIDMEKEGERMREREQ
jgi:hypothetical protein